MIRDLASMQEVTIHCGQIQLIDVEQVEVESDKEKAEEESDMEPVEEKSDKEQEWESVNDEMIDERIL